MTTARTYNTIPRPSANGRRIRDLDLDKALRATLDTATAILVPFSTTTTLARTLRNRYQKERIRLRVWRRHDGSNAAWLEHKEAPTEAAESL